MCDNCKLRITSVKSFVSGKGNLSDFIEKSKESNTSIKVCKHFLSRNEEEVIFQLMGYGLSISFEIENLPQEDLDAFFASAKKENAAITLTSEIDGNEEWLIFEVVFPGN